MTEISRIYVHLLLLSSRKKRKILRKKSLITFLWVLRHKLSIVKIYFLVRRRKKKSFVSIVWLMIFKRSKQVDFLQFPFEFPLQPVAVYREEKRYFLFKNCLTICFLSRREWIEKILKKFCWSSLKFSNSNIFSLRNFRMYLRGSLMMKILPFDIFSQPLQRT